MKNTCDLDEALEAIKAGASIDGEDGVLAPLIKQLIEATLEAELETHLGNELRNRKNGKSSKTMKSFVGEFDLEVPRDRNGTFEPQFVKKYQTHTRDKIEQMSIDTQLSPIAVDHPKNSFEVRMVQTYNNCRKQQLQKYLGFLTEEKTHVLLRDNYIQKKDVKGIFR